MSEQSNTLMLDDDGIEAEYLLQAIEKMKCDDCKKQCPENRCLYLMLVAKLEAIREVRDGE